MKKVLSIIIAAFCISLTYSYADNDKSTQEPKKPIMIFKGKPTVGIERSAQYVNAVLNLETKTIEMEFYGLGDGEIYIVDSDNKVVDSVMLTWEMTSVIMNSPINEGYYYLVVSCSEFYGEGVFEI